MDIGDAQRLITPAIPARGGTWADLGAGTGTFTRALVAQLGPEARVYAVDRDGSGLEELDGWATSAGATVVVVRADFTRGFDLPGLGGAGLDGILLANALHFVPDAELVLARLVARVRPGGSLVLVEYDQRPANRWVPHPIPVARLPALAAAAGTSDLVVVADRPSEYGGRIYAAAAVRMAVGLPG